MRRLIVSEVLTTLIVLTMLIGFVLYDHAEPVGFLSIW
ncbi:hypothetical protein J2X43_003512 [Rhizobium sp. BE258]|nr:hypothetical protein [Rhizobium sp. BE258]